MSTAQGGHAAVFQEYRPLLFSLAYRMLGSATEAEDIVQVTARFAPANARYAVANVNGKPTLLVQRAGGTPFAVVSIEVDHDRIRTVWAIGNPDKLRAV